MKIADKIGADKIISVYWFVILFIVAGAVVYVVSVFYGQPYDVRSTEAELLTDKIADFLSSGGYLTADWQTFENENFLENCKLTLSTEDDFGWSDDQYYLELNISEFGSNNILKKIFMGNNNLKQFCASSGENLPYCLERSFYTIDKQNNAYRIDILSIIRKTEKNA